MAHAAGKRDTDTATRFSEYVTALDRQYELAAVDYAQVIKPRPGGLQILRVSGFTGETLIGTSSVE